MRNQILSLAIMFAAILGAQAQEKIYVGIKCPQCVVIPLQKWDYSRTKDTEDLSTKNDFISINWREMTVEKWGSEKQKINEYLCFASKPVVKVWYGNKILTIYYNAQRDYTGHTTQDF